MAFIKIEEKKNLNFLVNEEIPGEEILLVENGQNLLVKKSFALQKAINEGLTLVCVAPKSIPPVCKLADYQKLIFDLKKKISKKKTSETKELRFSYNISENDLDFKLNRAIDFVNKNHLVKIVLVAKSREKSKIELGQSKCREIIDHLKIKSSKIEKNGEIHSHNGNFYFYIQKVGKSVK